MIRTLVAAALLAMNAPPTQADYPVCGAVHNGPLARQPRQSLSEKERFGMILLPLGLLALLILWDRT